MSHSYSSNLVHCVFSTRNRVNSIPPARQEMLHAYLFGIAKNLKISRSATLKRSSWLF